MGDKELARLWRENDARLKPETKRPHSLSFTPTVWAALEAEAARQGRSINNLLERLAIAATSTPEERK